MDRFWAVEVVLLPVVGAIVNGQFRAWGDSVQRPNVSLVGVVVPPDFHICPVDQTVVNTPPPAVSVRRVSVDDDRELAGFRESGMVVEVRPDVYEVLAWCGKPVLSPTLASVFNDTCAGQNGL